MSVGDAMKSLVPGAWLRGRPWPLVRGPGLTR